MWRPYDVFLNSRLLFGRQFNARVATRDHDRVGRINDRVQRLDCSGFLELGQDSRG